VTSALALAALVARTDGHAVLDRPPARPLGLPTGIKLTPFTEARSSANEGCGGPTNGGINNVIAQPTAVFQPGEQIGVEWLVTIPHDAGVTDTGIRIALHYAPGDSFEDNILRGGLEGEGDYIPVAAHDVGATAGTRVGSLVTLPLDKTCAYCTLQWVWAARTDGPNGGYYIGCADIAITTDGNLPDYAAIPSQVGKEIADGDVTDAEGNPIGSSGGSSNAGGIAAGVIIGLLALGGLIYFLKKRSASGGSMMPKLGGGAPPPPGGGLPPGWGSAVDPASGRTYYVNSATGATSWEPPLAAPGSEKQPGPPGPPGPPGAGSLPAGWTASTDPASGQTYYVNSITGATQWEAPASRV